MGGSVGRGGNGRRFRPAYPDATAHILLAVLAAVCDLRSRRVPAWLTGGGSAAGVLLAAWAGPPVLTASRAGAVAGRLIFLPFVKRGWLSLAERLLAAVT